MRHNHGTCNHSELHRTFPTSIHRRYSEKEHPSSTPSSRLRLAGGEGSRPDLGRRKRDFAGSEDSKHANGDPSRRRPSASFAVAETETGTQSLASTEEGETAEGRGRGLDGSDSTPTRALVDEDDIDRELDAATKAAPASVGGDKALDSFEAEGGSTGPAKIVAERGGVQENSDSSVTGGKGMGPKDDLDNAGHDGVQYPNNRQQPGYRSQSSKITRRGSARAGYDGIDGDGRKHASDRGEFELQHGDEDRNNCSSTELVLGRPDPTSVHWKFSRRLLQT